MFQQTGVSKNLFIFILLLSFYSFGPFGFFNLFGARLVVQFLILVIYIYILLNINPRINKNEIFGFILFAILIAFGSFFYRSLITYFIESFLFFFIYILISTSPKVYITHMIKYFVIITFILSILILVAYLIHIITPEIYYKVNQDIYDSTVGYNQIYVGHWVDYLSFTSGDGFAFYGKISPRMKGYSNEPSSTILYYLSPVIFGFYLGKRYNYLSAIIILINVICIGSMTSMLLLVLTIVIYIIYLLENIIGRKFRNVFLFFLICFLIYFLMSLDTLLTFQQVYGDKANDIAGFDLLSRKTNTLNVRQLGIFEGFKNLLKFPFGCPSIDLGAGAGLAFTISSYTGYIGVLLLFYYIFIIVKLINWYTRKKNNFKSKFLASFIYSNLFVLLFISGYGWDRLPGLLFLILLHKLFYNSFYKQHISNERM